MVRHLFFSSHTSLANTTIPISNNGSYNHYNIDNDNNNDNNNSTTNSLPTHQPSPSRQRASSTTLSSLTKRLPKVPFPHLPSHLPHLRRHSHTAGAVDNKNESHNYDHFSPLHSIKPYTNTTDTMSMSPVDTSTSGQNYDDLSPSLVYPLPASAVTEALLDSPRSSPKATALDSTHTNTLHHKSIDKNNNTHTLHIPSSPPAVTTNTDLNEPNSDHTSCNLFTIFNPLLLLCTPCHTATATTTTPLLTNDDEAINDVLVQNNNSNNDYNDEEDRYNSSFVKCVYLILYLYTISVLYIHILSCMIYVIYATFNLYYVYYTILYICIYIGSMPGKTLTKKAYSATPKMARISAYYALVPLVVYSDVAIIVDYVM